MAFDFNQLLDLWMDSAPPDDSTPPAIALVPVRQAKSWVRLATTPALIGAVNHHIWRFYLSPDQLFGIRLGQWGGTGIYYAGTRYTKSQNYYLYMVGYTPIFNGEDDVVAWYTTWEVFFPRDVL